MKRLQATFGASQLSAITPLQIDAYLTTRASACRPSSVNRETQVLRHMFKQAIAWGKALDNPVAHVRPLRANNRRLRYLSKEEIRSLLDAADDILRRSCSSHSIQAYAAARCWR